MKEHLYNVLSNSVIRKCQVSDSLISSLLLECLQNFPSESYSEMVRIELILNQLLNFSIPKSCEKWEADHS